jgi:glucans biosynthesis protein C
MLFFMYGYLVFANPRIGETVRRYCFVFLGVALAIGALVLVLSYVVFGGGGFFLAADLRALISWTAIMAILGVGARYLNRSGKNIRYANDAVLPFYILHQPVILSIGFFVVQWSLPIAAKYFIIAVSSFAAIMLLYELVVRRINVLRFLFGMKKQKRT